MTVKYRHISDRFQVPSVHCFFPFLSKNNRFVMVKEKRQGWNTRPVQIVTWSSGQCRGDYHFTCTINRDSWTRRMSLRRKNKMVLFKLIFFFHDIPFAISFSSSALIFKALKINPSLKIKGQSKIRIKDEGNPPPVIIKDVCIFPKCKCFVYSVSGFLIILLCVVWISLVFPYPMHASCIVKWYFNSLYLFRNKNLFIINFVIQICCLWNFLIVLSDYMIHGLSAPCHLRRSFL